MCKNIEILSCRKNLTLEGKWHIVRIVMVEPVENDEVRNIIVVGIRCFLHESECHESEKT